jgi:urease accessory protein
MSSPGLLKLLWLASPALPVGAFSYSEALEAGVEAGVIHDEITATEWITEQLHLSLSRSDLPVVAQAMLAWKSHDYSRIHQLNHWVLATRETHEFRRQTEQMGKSLQDWSSQFNTPSSASLAKSAPTMSHLALQAAGLVQPTYPVVCAAIAAHSQANIDDTLYAYAFGWAENQVQSAIKSVPLGQSQGQRALAHVCDQIPQAVAYAMLLDEDDRQAFSPMLALYSCWHETQYSRLFRS